MPRAMVGTGAPSDVYHFLLVSSWPRLLGVLGLLYVTVNAAFALTWTAIHPITEASPLHRASPAALSGDEGELIVSVIGFDESFRQTVHARYAYKAVDVVWGAHFVDILSWGPDGRGRVDYARFHDIVPAAEAERRAGPAGML